MLTDFSDSVGLKVVEQWLGSKNMHPFYFQQETWEHIHNTHSGLVNAPTGCGKTFSVFLGAVIRYINLYPDSWQEKRRNGLQLIWITPLRALAKDIGRAMEEALVGLNLPWQVGIRNGDTDTAERQRQKRNMPEVLIITPESLHLLLAQKDYPATFNSLRCIAVDEWHELLGSKRGVQVELAISRITGMRKKQASDENLHTFRPVPLMVWGISATIGNLTEAREVLLAPVIKNFGGQSAVIVKAEIRKDVVIESIFPDEIENYPWAGHLGIKLAHKLIPIIQQSRTTLIFINTRGMTERWYQVLLDADPGLAGVLAIHHGSIEQDLRLWVEDSLHQGILKAVVCTASLDLGVDFRPVETVVQVGSPKGVGRFLQRAGRSGHQPGEISRIYFLPTHSLELMEAAALKTAMEENEIESRVPMMLCFDVLIQYLCTLAISEGFRPEEILPEIRTTHCYGDITDNEWLQILNFITDGGSALQQYDEFKKVEVEDGIYRIKNRRVAMRHRMHIGTIVSESMMKVKFISGGFIGVIEEWFISRLTPGEVFTLSGRNLEFIMIKDMTAIVRKSNSKKSIVPSWQGGRMPLSANLGRVLRRKFDEAADYSNEPEIKVLRPLLDLQRNLSHVPRANELLIEQIETRDGFHLFVHTFEGRLVNEAMAALLAFRISHYMPITFSLAMNDYSFELLSDQPIPVDDSNVYELFSPDHLIEHIQRSANATEMAKRKFRDIAVIGGLIFQGFPGEQKKARHIQSSASLLFQVFHDYDPHNLLMRQAYQEVFDQQMEETRLRDMLSRIQKSKIILSFPEQLTPFSFPVKVDSLRENLSSEKLEDRVKRMQSQLGK